MWFRVILTAFALAVVLYLQFGFDIKDWVKRSSTRSGHPISSLESDSSNVSPSE